MCKNDAACVSFKWLKAKKTDAPTLSVPNVELVDLLGELILLNGLSARNR